MSHSEPPALTPKSIAVGGYTPIACLACKTSSFPRTQLLCSLSVIFHLFVQRTCPQHFPRALLVHSVPGIVIVLRSNLRDSSRSWFGIPIPLFLSIVQVRSVPVTLVIPLLQIRRCLINRDPQTTSPAVYDHIELITAQLFLVSLEAFPHYRRRSFLYPRKPIIIEVKARTRMPCTTRRRLGPRDGDLYKAITGVEIRRELIPAPIKLEGHASIWEESCALDTIGIDVKATRDHLNSAMAVQAAWWLFEESAVAPELISALKNIPCQARSKGSGKMVVEEHQESPHASGKHSMLLPCGDGIGIWLCYL